MKTPRREAGEVRLKTKIHFLSVTGIAVCDVRGTQVTSNWVMSGNRVPGLSHTDEL
jgi:hypothetical protein